MKRLLLPVLILSALAVGCKPASLAGTYKSDKAGDLVLVEGGDFTMKSGNNPMGEMKGKWKEGDGKVALTPESVGGKPMATVIGEIDKLKALGMKQAQIDEIKGALKEMDATVDKDRKVLTIKIGNQSAAFTKAP